jgi:hypothetical protein
MIQSSLKNMRAKAEKLSTLIRIILVTGAWNSNALQAAVSLGLEQIIKLLLNYRADISI